MMIWPEAGDGNGNDETRLVMMVMQQGAGDGDDKTRGFRWFRRSGGDEY